jgi:hypothetical protein
MKLARSLFLAIVAGITGLTAQTHPRLFFDAAELTQIRTKLDREPFKTMLTTLEATKDVGNFYLPMSETDASRLLMRASAEAMLYSLTGIEQHAVDCKADVQSAFTLIDANNDWADTTLKGLTSYWYATRTSMCYDLCYNSPSWDSIFKADVSARLLSIATMIINNGGTEQNSQFSSNWQANRASSGGIALLATDDAYDDALMVSAMQRLNNFFTANQGSSTRGWNPEGAGYTAYLYGSFVGPFAIALDRLQPARSVSEQAGMKWMPWTGFAGAVPATANNPYNVYGLGGVKTDWSDDNAHIGGEGLYGLAFRFSPPSLLPGLRHSYDRLQGSLAPDGGLWDASRHGIFWSILYYPENTPSQNPLEIWDWQDANGAPVGLGLVTFRDGFRGQNDILVHFKARTKVVDSNSHDGPDGLGFRVLGPNAPFVVGGGRDNPGRDRNQATVYPNDPNVSPVANKNAGTYHGTPLIKPDGGGHAIASMTANNVGTTTHKRWIVTDFDRATTGADATVIVADTTGNGRYWQLPTFLDNTVTVTGSIFTITGQNGATLQGTIIHPGGTPLITVGTKARGSGYTLQNGGTLATESVSNPQVLNNRYLYIENTTDNNFLVVMTIQKNGGRHPVVARNSGTIADAVIQVGGRSYGLQTDNVLYDGAPYVYPDSTVTFTAGPNGLVSGSTVQSIARGAAATAPTATPDAGFVFAGWNKAYDKVVTPMTVTALFTPTIGPAPTLALAASSWRIDEAAGTASISVTRSGNLTGAVGVSYATANGSATAGDDYTAASGSLSWAAGDGATKTITVPILNNTILENDEDFTLALSNPTGGAVLTAPVSAVVTISDNESLPVQSTLALTNQNVTVSENGSSVSISVARLLSTAGAVTVNYATSPGAAAAGVDFTPVSGTLSWAAGEAGTKSFNIPIIDDLLVEPNETFTVNLSNATGGAVLGSPATATVTILENEVNVTPSITIDRPTGGVAALSSISQSLQLAATTSDDGQPGPLSFLWEKISGPGAVTFGNAASEDTDASFSVAGVYQLRLTASDGLLSDSETVLVNAASVGSSGLVTLVNYPFTHLINELPAGWNDPSVTAANISASAVGIVGASFVGGAVNEVRFTDTATTSFSSSDNFLFFQLTAAPGYYFDLTNPLSAISFKHDLNSGGAQATRMQIFAGTNASGPLLFTSTETNSTIQDPTTIQDVGAIAAINGTNRYRELYFQVQWKNIGTAISSVYRFDNFKIDGAVVSAVDNMGPVTTAGPDSSAQINTAFPLSGSANDDGLPASPGALTYLWRKVSGPGNVVFANAGNPATTATFSSTGIHVLSLTADDGAIATSDTVTITVTSNVPLPPAPASGLSASAIAYNRIDLSWTDNASDETGFKILRSHTSAAGFAEIGTAAANATSYSDTTCSAETTYFYQVIASNTNGDSVPSNEATATTPVAPPPVPGTIRLGAATYQAAENAGSVTLTAQRIGGVNGAVSVSFAAANGSATAGSDYTAASGTLTWLDGDSADKTMVITLQDDSTYEGDETFTLTLTNPTGGATLGTPAAATVTILDNESAPTPVATSIAVTPANAVITANASQQFSAVLRDQFGQPMASQPSFSWSVTGGGSINSAGLFTAGTAAGSFSVSAAASAITGSASFSVSTAIATLLVNWGGDYVAANTNYSRTVSAVANAYPSGTGRSKSLAWSENTVLNPTSSYSGVSSIFYGGYFTSHDGTATTAANITASNRITNNTSLDQLYYRFQTPADTGKTATTAGGGISWVKNDFLALSAATIVFNSTSSLNMSIQTLSGGMGVRWMVKDGSQWYISNTSHTTTGSKSLSGASLLAESWLAFNPETSLLEPTGTYAPHTFGSITAVGYFGWANLTGTAATTSDMVVTAFSANGVAAPPANTAPTVSAIADQTIDADNATAALAITIGDAESAAASLALSGSSSNITLVPNGNIVFGGTAENRTVTVTPAAGQSGAATITVSVSDGALSSPEVFALTVNPPPPASGYASWSDTAFPEGATPAEREPAFDFDKDGLCNLVEYGLGSNPSAANPAPAAQIVNVSGQDYLQIQWTRPNDRSDIATLGELSSDLAPLSWSSDSAEVLTTITPAGEGLETVTIRDADPLSANTKRFLRARVILTP